MDGDYSYYGLEEGKNSRTYRKKAGVAGRRCTIGISQQSPEVKRRRPVNSTTGGRSSPQQTVIGEVDQVAGKQRGWLKSGRKESSRQPRTDGTAVM